MEIIENPVIGEKIVFLTTSKKSNGAKSLMEVYLGPKGGNPLHYHKRFSETFKVIEGELNVQIGKDIKDTAMEATAAVQDQLEQVSDVAGEYIQRGRDEMMQMAESFEEQIRAQPSRSIMVAAGVGFLFGALWLRH